MKPAAVIPMNDPEGKFFPHLRTITPSLKSVFERVFISVTAVTRQHNPCHLSWLQSDPFYDTLLYECEQTPCTIILISLQNL